MHWEWYTFFIECKKKTNNYFTLTLLSMFGMQASMNSCAIYKKMSGSHRRYRVVISLYNRYNQFPAFSPYFSRSHREYVIGL